jgi:2-keto-4-pentenoate hydratase/2-oxohepta-3-ene-1,7-dioic acid hydratase in catechol pathway
VREVLTTMGSPELPGVGYFRDPPVTLRPGDTVETEVESVGTLTNPVVG